MYTGENGPMTVKDSRNRNSNAAFRAINTISNCFQRSKLRFNNYITRQPENFKTICACTESTGLI